MKTNLKILTLNIWNQKYYWKQRLKTIVTLINRKQPDLIGLQEIVDSSDAKGNQAEQITQRLDGYSHFFSPAHKHSSGHWGGPAILSKLPILETHAQLLTKNSGDPLDRYKKNAIGIIVKIPQLSFKLAFINTHLSLSEAACNRTVKEISEFASQISDEQTYRIIVGDFNVGPESLAIRFLTGKEKINGKKDDYIDIWESCHPDSDAITWPVSKTIVEANWKIRNPNKPLPYTIYPKRIDFIFLARKLISSIGELESCELVGGQTSPDGIPPSDHFGVLGNIRLNLS
jgi:endonuclease/exonuclease/phosphatase family metal-dependent hydrolase